MTELDDTLDPGVTEVAKNLKLTSTRTGNPLGLYVLDGFVPRPAKSLDEWGQFFAKADRTVALSELPPHITVSTVFLGVDHSHFGTEAILFETMVFHAESGFRGGLQRRYTCWADAEAGHAEIVAELEATLAVPNGTPAVITPPEPPGAVRP